MRNLGIIACLLVGTFALGCASTGDQKFNVTPDQVWTVAKIGTRAAAVVLVSSKCGKDGRIAGVPCGELTAQAGAMVDTFAADFRPGAAVDPAARLKTRDSIAVQVARLLHKDDFTATDDLRSTLQSNDIAEAHSIIDPIADAFVAALGK